MALIDVTVNPTVRQLRQFGLIFFPIFSGLVAWWAARAAFALPVVAALPAAAGAVAVMTAVRPELVRPLFVGWMRAAFPIGWVISHVVFALAYYVVVTLVGRLMALAGKDPLQRALDRARTTYFEPVEVVRDRAQYFRQF
jgi:hypothetical protein